MTSVDTTMDVNTNTPGAALGRVRQSLGLTEDEVAIQLHLSRHIIEAIEQDQYEKLPGLTFARGYLRAYAKLLNVPIDEVMKAFNVLYPSNRENTVVLEKSYQRQALFKQRKHSESSGKWIGYVILIIMIGLVITWWHNHNNSSELINKNKTNFQTTTLQPATASNSGSAAALPNSGGAVPAVGPGDNNQAQMTVTNPTAANVNNAVANVPGMQADPSVNSQNAQAKTIDVGQTTANAAAVPGLATGMDTSTTQSTQIAPAAQKPAGWHNPDDN